MLSAEEKEYLKSVSPLSGRGLSVLFGNHPTRAVGAGGDFFQLRPYVLGDDTRRMAWRLSARQPNKWLVKDAIHEGPMRWRYWVDATASMRLPERAPMVAKIQEAMVWVWARHRDQWRPVQDWAWSSTPLVIISDLIWSEAEWAEFRRLRRNQSVRVIQVSLRDEVEWSNPPEYVEDCESRARHRIDGDLRSIHARQRVYWDQVREHLRGVPLASMIVETSDLAGLEGVIWT